MTSNSTLAAMLAAVPPRVAQRTTPKAPLSSHLQLGRMSVAYICVGAVINMAISQASGFFPAMRAASISPTDAIRAH